VIQFLLLVLVLLTGAPGWAQSGSKALVVEPSLVSDRHSVQAGERFHLALHQKIPPGWHTYWRNPGDSGAPTRLELTLPEGWGVGEMIWPAPRSYDLGPLTNYGYSTQITLPVPVTVPADAPPGAVDIPAFATWLVCEEVCIPEQARLTLGLVVGDSVEDTQGVHLIRAALQAAPVADPQLQAGLTESEAGVTLTVLADRFDDAPISDLAFYPHEAGVIDHAADQAVQVQGAAVRVDVAGGYLARNGVSEPRDGVLVYTVWRSDVRTREAVGFTATPGAVVNTLGGVVSSANAGVNAPADPVRIAAPASISFLRAAGLALIGGLILNLMPCVFPVLSMKALTLVEKRGAERSQARMMGLVFAAGVIGAFLTLGGLLLILRVAGLPALWGMQLQAPLVVAALSVLMFLIGLNLLGLFEAGVSLQSVGSSVKDSGYRGSFFTGVLAVFVAAPCLAPFMTGALAFALTQPAIASLTIFAFLGVGLAFPFVLVSFVPGLLAFLPRPGMWMMRFRQILAFPMFAAAIWLIWVLTVQLGADGVLWLLLALLAAGFTVWALGLKGIRGRATAMVGLVLTLGALSVTARMEPVSSSTRPDAGAWRTWSVAAVAQARSEGRPVFVDFTAAWCVTCQVNKLGVLADADVQAAFAEYDVALFRADFTRQDPTIAAELDRHGAAGVPLYLVYPSPSGPPQMLPPLLTETLVIGSIKQAVSSWDSVVANR